MEPKPNQRGIVIRNQWLSSDYMFPAANVTHADEVLWGSILEFIIVMRMLLNLSL